MLANLPAEVWTQIFDLAADEDILFQRGIPTVLAETAWHKDVFRGWALRSPQMAMNLLQTRSYATKKAIISTCRQWHDLGSEFLFRCLYFNNTDKLTSACAILDTSASAATTATSSYGWWTRRIHMSRFSPPGMPDKPLEELENVLVSIVRHCPNLEIFVIEKPMGTAFGPVVDALATYAFRNLHTVQWTIPGESLSKLIWALNALPLITAIHIEIESEVPSAQECAHLGSAAGMQLQLPYLQQLSLCGCVEEFVEQAAGWDLPSLRTFSLDSCTTVHDVPDVAEFLKAHGLLLLLLDLNCHPLVDIAAILDLCPNLTTFTFNADWRIVSHADDASHLTNRPHPSIHTVGLHGLTMAFGVGLAASSESDPAPTLGLFQIRTRVTQRLNDLNMAALNKQNFPNLKRVRALNRIVLDDLNRANGPSADGGYARWSKWWEQCAAAGIRLEDCTGQFLGTLPDDEDVEEEDDDDDEEDGDEEEVEVDDDDDWGTGSEEEGSEDDTESEYDFPPLPEGNGRTMELTRLLQEVRAMNQGRDEQLIASIRPPEPTAY